MATISVDNAADRTSFVRCDWRGEMAGMREMALGIASALRSGLAPNPLPVELWGYAPEDAAHLLRYLADECADAEIEVHEIRADPVVVHELSGSKTEAGVVHRGIVITADATCHGRLDLYRSPVGGNS